jgi:cyclohexanone monooxygenase
MYTNDHIAKSIDVVIVGAGFGGMYMLHRARQLGLSACIIESGEGVGGTWYWNRYPGARCDVQSMSYSYSFSEELQERWSWPDRYAAQQDILRYANHVADKYDLRRSIVFKTRVTAAHYKATANKWLLQTDAGHKFAARFCIMATGCLSVPKTPDIAGLENFSGEIYHTANWPPAGVDFTGKRVGLIGTGSSGIQSTPIIAAEAKQLIVFQRTPNFSIPAWNAPLTPGEEREIKELYGELRQKSRISYAGDWADEYVVSILALSEEQREAEFEKRWRQGGFNFQYAFADLLESEAANRLAAEFVHRKIREKVRDPAVAEKLCPKDHSIGTKRLCVDTNYYETFNRPNVTLVDLRATPIQEVIPTAFRTSAQIIELDCIVLATGFDAMTGALTRIDVRGRAGKSLARQWKHGARAYLGLAVAGFPNMFIVTGPGSPSVLANMILACEQHVEWIADCIHYMKTHRLDTIEATSEAQEEWARKVTESANRTLYPKANSWYVGANVPGKPRAFMPFVDGFGIYNKICERVAAAGYEGFEFSRVSGSADRAWKVYEAAAPSAYCSEPKQ